MELNTSLLKRAAEAQLRRCSYRVLLIIFLQKFERSRRCRLYAGGMVCEHDPQSPPRPVAFWIKPGLCGRHLPTCALGTTHPRILVLHALSPPLPLVPSSRRTFTVALASSRSRTACYDHTTTPRSRIFFFDRSKGYNSGSALFPYATECTVASATGTCDPEVLIAEMEFASDAEAIALGIDSSTAEESDAVGLVSRAVRLTRFYPFSP